MLLGAVLCALAAVSASPQLVTTRSEIEEYKSILEQSRQGKDGGDKLEDSLRLHPHSKPWEVSGKYQGDILLQDDQIEDMVGERATGRKATTRPNARWPQATVVYEFRAGDFNLEQRNYILHVMERLSVRTCVRFRPRTARDRDYVTITGNNDGCYAHVGYTPNGVHNVNLTPDAPGQGCLNFATIGHEWLHILGFYHMQSTYSRDNYVRIHWENVQNGFFHAFERYDHTDNLGLPYDYSSCMHYSTHAFTGNGRPTISTTRYYDGILGQYDFISGWDIWRLQRLYNCPGAWSPAAMEAARTTVLTAGEDGLLVERKLDIPLADELRYLEDDEA